MNEITLSAYAKINLSLDVTGRRENGYHDVRMVMQSIGLCDTITVRKCPQKGPVTLDTALPELGRPEDNLAVRAAALLCHEYHITDALSIHLEKHIPVAAGMAGGSTDAAAALRAVNELYSLGLDWKTLAKYGVRLGADIPYCLLSGTALSEGIGEILTPLPKAPDCHVLLVNPGIPISTGAIYSKLDHSPGLHHPDVDKMVQAIHAASYPDMAQSLENILETVTINETPIIADIKQKMYGQGADGALMSGSGPTVFGLFSEKNTCQKAKDWFLSQNKTKWQIYTVQFQERI